MKWSKNSFKREAYKDKHLEEKLQTTLHLKKLGQEE